MKTGAKDKFLLCFRPVEMEGAIDSNRNDGSGNPVFTYIAVADKGNLTIPAILSSLPEETSKVPEGETVETVGRRRKRKARKVLSRILKAVLFETSLMKKIRNKKDRQDSYRSKSDKFSNVTDEESVHKKLEDDDRKIVMTESSLSSSTLNSSSFSSSRSSSLASNGYTSESKNSRSLSERKKSFRSNSLEPKQRNSFQELGQKPKKTVSGYYGPNTGLYLLLVSLSVMIFWGRVCAILCTATWLYFVYRWDTGDDRPENVIKSPEIDSREYKKKVIMEGLLERNHHRGQ